MTHPVFAKILPENNLQVFADMEPTHLGHVAGYDFYEHPKKGDTAPLYAVAAHRQWGPSHFWDVPSIDELIELEAV